MPKRPLYRFGAIGLALLAMVLVGQASYQIGTSHGEPVAYVTAGDTLWGIAHEYGVSVNALASANGMRLTDTLPVGRHLVIPTGAAAKPAPGSTAPTAKSRGAAAAQAATAAREQRVNFCETFRSQPGPSGVLPWLLSSQAGRLSERPYFVRWADAYGVSPALLEAIGWEESGWQQHVVSSAGAIGVGQVLPTTARFVSEELLHEQLNVRSINDNIQLAARFLAYVSGETGGNLCQTIAAYNEGIGNLDSYGVLPITQRYVANVEALLPRFE